MLLCILVTFGHGFCLLFDKLLKYKTSQLKFIGSLQNCDERKENSNNHDLNNESRNQVSSSSLNRMMNQNLSVRNMSKLDQHISSSNVKTRVHFNEIKPKYKCVIGDHVKMPLNEADQNHHDIINLTRINKDQCLLIHNEVKSKKHLHLQPMPTLLIKKPNYSNEVDEIPENDNLYLNDNSYLSNETKASMKSSSFRQKVNVNDDNCGGYDNDDDDDDDDDDDANGDDNDNNEDKLLSPSTNNPSLSQTSSKYQQNTEHTNALSTFAMTSYLNTYSDSRAIEFSSIKVFC
ncbi:hypothetical protein MS3_00010622 [Schistosoma haematobium]|uniref:Uncharacterized protein n=1 Tax=Schistosoma haematobium TaxID=6185 RepID=A0A922S0B9_SCHHA|nr:hypothetical protein MS3_00010622 [Schistosoma haematobium]KAH9587830.1 hypothetical protein MS3_00010622 [Schistosoma haematobium]